MHDNLTTAIVSIVLAIIGVATLALWLNSAGTGPKLINAAGGQLANLLKVVVSPVSGGGLSGTLSLPSLSVGGLSAVAG
jgi:hypothetical protein